MDKSDEWYEGYDGFCEGLSDLDNPYEHGSEKAMDWYDGYSRADQDSEEGVHVAG